MLKLLLLACCCVMLLAACSLDRSAPATSTNQVHMSNTAFDQPSITIKKGESVTLVADTLIAHIIANGSWQNNAPDPTRESGAPLVNSVVVGGNSAGSVGPFATAGTFRLYCTIHPGMQLTVIVQ